MNNSSLSSINKERNHDDLSHASSVFKNAWELLRDAEVLFREQRYKRSLFLILAAVEEIVKAIRWVDGKRTPRDLYNHDSKFKGYYVLYENVSAALTRDVFITKIQKSLFDSGIDVTTGKVLNFIENNLADVHGVINPSTLRELLLYRDFLPEDSLKLKLISDTTLEKVCLIAINSLSNLKQEFNELQNREKLPFEIVP